MISSGVDSRLFYTIRTPMEQSDLDLLQMVPSYHVQAVVKTRLGVSFRGQSNDSPSSLTVIAESLFDPASVQKAMQHLSELEHLILRELVSCGGRANSRDLALYFTCSGLLNPARKPEQIGAYAGFDEPVEPMVGSTSGLLQYPTAHPHGIFEQSIRHLLVLGLVFWGRQTNFAGRDYSSGLHD